MILHMLTNNARYVLWWMGQYVWTPTQNINFLHLMFADDRDFILVVTLDSTSFSDGSVDSRIDEKRS